MSSPPSDLLDDPSIHPSPWDPSPMPSTIPSAGPHVSVSASASPIAPVSPLEVQIHAYCSISSAHDRSPVLLFLTHFPESEWTFAADSSQCNYIPAETLQRLIREQGGAFGFSACQIISQAVSDPLQPTDPPTLIPAGPRKQGFVVERRQSPSGVLHFIRVTLSLPQKPTVGETTLLASRAHGHSLVSPSPSHETLIVQSSIGPPAQSNLSSSESIAARMVDPPSSMPTENQRKQSATAVARLRDVVLRVRAARDARMKLQQEGKRASKDDVAKAMNLSKSVLNNYIRICRTLHFWGFVDLKQDDRDLYSFAPAAHYLTKLEKAELQRISSRAKLLQFKSRVDHRRASDGLAELPTPPDVDPDCYGEEPVAKVKWNTAKVKHTGNREMSKSAESDQEEGDRLGGDPESHAVGNDAAESEPDVEQENENESDNEAHEHCMDDDAVQSEVDEGVEKSESESASGSGNGEDDDNAADAADLESNGVHATERSESQTTKHRRSRSRTSSSQPDASLPTETSKSQSPRTSRKANSSKLQEDRNGNRPTDRSKRGSKHRRSESRSYVDDSGKFVSVTVEVSAEESECNSESDKVSEQTRLHSKVTETRRSHTNSKQRDTSFQCDGPNSMSQRRASKAKSPSPSATDPEPISEKTEHVAKKVKRSKRRRSPTPESSHSRSDSESAESAESESSISASDESAGKEGNNDEDEDGADESCGDGDDRSRKHSPLHSTQRVTRSSNNEVHKKRRKKRDQM